MLRDSHAPAHDGVFGPSAAAVARLLPGRYLGRHLYGEYTAYCVHTCRYTIGSVHDPSVTSPERAPLHCLPVAVMALDEASITTKYRHQTRALDAEWGQRMSFPSSLAPDLVAGKFSHGGPSFSRHTHTQRSPAPLPLSVDSGPSYPAIHTPSPPGQARV
jgi:hypothetical protein